MPYKLNIFTGNLDLINSSSGTSAGFQVPTSGALNQGTFVFAKAPNVICVDEGRIMQKVSKDGTVNWTGTTTINLTIWPTMDIFGIA